MRDMVEYANKRSIKSCWFGLLKKDGNHYSVLVYAYKKNKNWEQARLRLAMLIRSDETGAYWSANVNMRYGYGYTYLFGEIEDVTDSDDFCGFNKLDNWNTNPRLEPANDWDAVLKEGNPELSYIKNIDSILLTYFSNKIAVGLRNILSYPGEIEMLQKLNLLEFVTNSKALEMDPKDLRKCISYARKSSKIDITDIPTVQWNLKNGFAPKNAFTFDQRMAIGKIRKRLGDKATVPEAIEVYKYLRHDGYVFDYDISEYFEYIGLRKELRLDIQDHSARFPSDLGRAYSALLEEKKQRQDEMEKELIRKSKPFISFLDSLCASVKGPKYSLYHPSTEKQFRYLGRILHNCVGSMGYHRRQMLGKCAIFGIKKDGKLYACLELCPNKENETEIEQLYLAHNKVCDEATRKFVKKEIIPRISFPEL